MITVVELEDEELLVVAVEAAEPELADPEELEPLDEPEPAAGVLAAGVPAAGVLMGVEEAPATVKLQGLPAPGKEMITGMDTEMLGVEQTPRMLTYPTSQTH